MAAHVRPNLHGQYVTFLLARHNATGWHTIGVAEVRLSLRSSAAVLDPYVGFSGRSVIGVPMRLKVVYKGDDTHAKSVSTFINFRVTA